MTAQIGHTYGRLLVLAQSQTRKQATWWFCRCQCGNEIEAKGARLTGGTKQSCGCLQREHTISLKYRHGLHGQPIYRTWRGMISRCYNKKSQDYPDYGARGIKLCEFLRISPANVLTLLGERPTNHHSVDRIENDGNYSCGSCAECHQNHWPLNIRWATQKQQTRNTRRNLLFSRNGQTKTVAEWSEITGISYSAFYKRLKRGQDPFVLP